MQLTLSYSVLLWAIKTSMEKSHSWEFSRSSASQIPALYGTCPYPKPDQFNPYFPTLYSWRYILILYSHLSLTLPSSFFLSGFPTRNLCAPLRMQHAVSRPLSSRCFSPQVFSSEFWASFFISLTLVTYMVRHDFINIVWHESVCLCVCVRVCVCACVHCDTEERLRFEFLHIEWWSFFSLQASALFIAITPFSTSVKGKVKGWVALQWRQFEGLSRSLPYTETDSPRRMWWWHI